MTTRQQEAEVLRQAAAILEKYRGGLQATLAVLRETAAALGAEPGADGCP